MKKAEALVNAFFPTEMIGQKEGRLLKEITDAYKKNDYKVAINAIEKILKMKKDKGSGETLALKGLMLNLMGLISEAYDCACSATKKSNQSIFCWIIGDLICQADFNYEKAIDDLKIAPINIELLRYLSLLQAQMRDLPGFVDSRCRILEMEPNDEFHHIAAAISHHLNTNCSKAIEILEGYEKSLVHGYSSEHEEMLLYKISLLEESGNFAEAQKELHDNKLIIVNKIAFEEQQCSLLVKLNALNDAKRLYIELLSQNPENCSYHAGLQKCVLSDNGHYSLSEIQGLKDLYKSLGEQHISSSAVKRKPLDFLQGDEFREALDIYINPLLHERVPSLFSSLCSLYEHPDKEQGGKIKEETTTSRVPNSEKLQDNKSFKKHEKAHAKELGDKNKEETSASRASESGERQHSKPFDSDPIGAKLLQVENPLMEATKYLKLLRKSSPDSFEACFLLSELSMRKQEMVQAYEALNELDRLEKDNPDTLRCLVRFYGRLDGMVLEESVQTMLAIPLSNLQKQSLIKLIENFLQRHKESLVHRFATAEMLFFLQPYNKSAIIELLQVTTELPLDKKKLWRLKDCIAVHGFLKSVLGDAAKASVWKVECSQLFPSSRYFSATESGDDTSEKLEIWLFDTGAVHNLIRDASLLSRTINKPGTFNVSSGNDVSYKKVGEVYLECGNSGRLLLKDVCQYSAFRNIVSVPSFTRDHLYSVQFFDEGFFLRDKSFIESVPPEFILATGSAVNMRYMFMLNWKLDSGANEHSTSDESLLEKVDNCNKRVAVSADGSNRTVTRVGSCKLSFTSKNGMTHKFVLPEVYVFFWKI